VRRPYWLEVTDHRHYPGNVMLVWGNGIDLINDYHTTLEPWLAPVMEWVNGTLGPRCDEEP
jgi:hypothetical protein